jgi:hypothetical protein
MLRYSGTKDSIYLNAKPRRIAGEVSARLQILAARQPRGQRLRRPQPGLLLRGDGRIRKGLKRFRAVEHHRPITI